MVFTISFDFSTVIEFFKKKHLLNRYIHLGGEVETQVIINEYISDIQKNERRVYGGKLPKEYDWIDMRLTVK